MTPLHAYIAAGAIVILGAWTLIWAMAKAAGDADDREGRPRG